MSGLLNSLLNGGSYYVSNSKISLSRTNQIIVDGELKGPATEENLEKIISELPDKTLINK